MNLKELGRLCRRHRLIYNITVEEIARICHYSKWNIYKFECGMVDSASILMAYVYWGMDVSSEEVWQALKKF